MAASAIVAVIHDIIFTIGVYALFQFQVTPATVTAFLTILGFSLYDTVVVFDKVGEYQTHADRDRPLDVRRDGEPVAERGADALALDVARRAAAGPVAADRRLRHPRRDRARRLRARPRGRSVHRFVLVDLRRRAAARVVEGAGAAVPRARRPPPAHAASAAASASTGVPVVRARRRPATPTSRAAARRARVRPRCRVAPIQARAPPAARPQAQVASEQRSPAPPVAWSGSGFRACVSKAHVRDIPDYPKPGSSSRTSRRCSPRPTPSPATVDALAAPFADEQIDKVLGIEARGLRVRGAGRVPPRGRASSRCARPGKLPWEIEREEYELEYGTDLLEIHRDAVAPGRAGADRRRRDRHRRHRGRDRAAGRAPRRRGRSASRSCIELGFLDGRKKLAGYDVHTVVAYDVSVATSIRCGSVKPSCRDARGAASTPRCGRCVESRPRARTAAPTPTLIEHAYEVARDAHRDQVRRSGDPYIAHPVGVAMILADLGLDDVTLAAALLHDAVEDTSVTLADLDAEFGPDVAAIVDGVTKLDRLQFDSKEAQQAATMRKMLVAMAKDVRVLLIKLADRLHNMRTIASLPEAKQKRIAQETLDIYAPLAHRLGIQDVKWQLEDLAFAVLHPKRYAEIEAMVLQHAGEREAYLDDVLAAGARPARAAPHQGRGHRPAEALLVDLREDGRARQGVRRDQRPRRRARDRRLGEGLLRRARLDPRVVASGAGPVQGLHRDAQVQPLPVVAHDGGGPAGPARSSSRSAPTRCTGAPSTASPRTGATRSSATRPRTSSGCSGSSTGSRRRPTRPSSCRA